MLLSSPSNLKSSIQSDNTLRPQLSDCNTSDSNWEESPDPHMTTVVCYDDANITLGIVFDLTGS